MMIKQNETHTHCGSLFTWEGKKGYAHAADFDYDVCDLNGSFTIRSHRTGNIRNFNWIQNKNNTSCDVFTDGHHTITIYN